MGAHKIVSQSDWLEARKRLLAEEKEFTQARDRLGAARRALPWVRVEKNYVFDTPQGKKTLADLFDGRSQLIVQHFMFAPDWTDDIRPQTVVQNMITQHAQERSFYYTNIFTANWMRQQNPSMTEGFLWRITNTKDLEAPFSPARTDLLWSGYRLRCLDEPERGYWDEYTDVMKDSYGIGHDFMGYYCFNNGMPLQAVWSFQNALKYRQTQTQGRIYIMLSQVYMALRNAQAALDAAQTALKLEPGNPYGYVRLGEALLGLGNMDGARQSFETARSIAPQLPEVQQGLSFIDQLSRASTGAAKP